MRNTVNVLDRVALMAGDQERAIARHLHKEEIRVVGRCRVRGGPHERHLLVSVDKVAAQPLVGLVVDGEWRARSVGGRDEADAVEQLVEVEAAMLVELELGDALDALVVQRVDADARGAVVHAGGENAAVARKLAVDDARADVGGLLEALAGVCGEYARRAVPVPELETLGAAHGHEPAVGAHALRRELDQRDLVGGARRRRSQRAHARHVPDEDATVLRERNVHMYNIC